MPTYAYACTACDHTFDALQSFSDDPLSVCPECEGRLRKVYTSIGVAFKGSGFYRTDSRSGATGGKTVGASGGKDAASNGGSSAGSSESKPSSGSASPSTSGSGSAPAASSPSGSGGAGGSSSGGANS